MLINSTATPVSINIMRILVVTCALLTIPLFAMQFTNEVNWSIADFLVMGGMLFTASLLATYAYQRLPFQLKKNRSHSGYYCFRDTVGTVSSWSLNQTNC